jgi:hypothetical protein
MNITPAYLLGEATAVKNEQQWSVGEYQVLVPDGAALRIVAATDKETAKIIAAALNKARREYVATHMRREKPGGTVEVKAGDIIRYKYHGEWEYAKYIDPETRELIGAEPDQMPDIPPLTRIVQGVWKKDKFEPRREFLWRKPVTVAEKECREFREAHAEGNIDAINEGEQ